MYEQPKAEVWSQGASAEKEREERERKFCKALVDLIKSEIGEIGEITSSRREPSPDRKELAVEARQSIIDFSEKAGALIREHLGIIEDEDWDEFVYRPKK
jgi:hypothetical protein